MQQTLLLWKHQKFIQKPNETCNVCRKCLENAASPRQILTSGLVHERSRTSYRLTSCKILPATECRRATPQRSNYRLKKLYVQAILLLLSVMYSKITGECHRTSKQNSVEVRCGYFFRCISPLLRYPGSLPVPYEPMKAVHRYRTQFVSCAAARCARGRFASYCF